MKSRWYIGALSSLVVSTYLLANQLFVASPPSAVTVFAGTDTYTCMNQNLQMSSLNATISGDNVTNGDWITLGDGKFSPSNNTSGRFSTTTYYTPGPNDRQLGFYRLLLIADPSMINPNERVQDEVKVTFTAAPPIVCSTNLSISLNELCTQKIEVSMLVPNPQQPFSLYVLTVFDKNGIVIPNNTVNRTHLNQELTYKLGHTCTSNFCWGKLTVKDYYPPIFNCKNDTIDCVKSILPDSLGWPFPSAAYVDTIINGNFIVKNWDACSDVTLRYVDEVIAGSCLTLVDRRIKRIWTATDTQGNTGSCEEWIVINRTNINNIVFPGHFDNVVHPAFECNDTFPTLANGHPSPTVTGSPYIGSCSHIQYNYTDIPFDLCGDSYKIVRSWFVIDWCTSFSITKNQFIYVIDTKGPEIICLDTLALEAGAYDCSTAKILLPAPTVDFDCNETTYTVTLLKQNGDLLPGYINKENNGFYVDKLPIGTYQLAYVVTDECNNSSTCNVTLTVADKLAPYVACDQLTRVSLDNMGQGYVFATTFDDHSFDNCGIASYRVRRMSAACGQMPEWRDRALFCCEDIGTTQRVALEVTDIYGNKNTCMVDVIVDDKDKPEITCPPDISIECDQSYQLQDLQEYGTVRTSPALQRDVMVFNAYHNGFVGRDGLAKDNCHVRIDSVIKESVTCFKGKIERTFTATDRNNNSSSCKQTISLLNPDPFDASDIIPPATYVGNGCMETELLPAVTGQPTYKNTDCATVASNYEDQRFYIAEGACLKIIRTWTIIDWCQYKQVGDPGKFGPYIQIIKIHNTDAPRFVTPCRDTTICSYDTGCQGGRATIDHSAVDACTSVDLLQWRFEVDFFDNGTVDTTSASSSFDAWMPMGKHKVTFKVDDQCGNRAVCSHYVTITDCKAPSPYCHGELSTSIDGVKGDATVWARDFDLGATDNCTSTSNLIFTFDGALPSSSRINQRHFFIGNGVLSDTSTYIAGLAQVWIPGSKTSGKYFDCSDLIDGIQSIIKLSVTVTDLSGNQDSCSVDLRLTDNNDFCTDVTNNVTLSGRIATTNGIILNNALVSNRSGELLWSTFADTTSGHYAFEKLPLDQPYTITPTKKDGVIDGVSTLDLVKIQRHILGISILDSPYKLIAADVNGSKSVTASDLVDLRKLILGITDRFPKEADPWTFVPSSYVFADPKVPFYYEKSIFVGALEEEMIDQDFVAIKLGDVDESAKGNLQPQNISNRRKSIPLSWKCNTTNQTIEVFGPPLLSIDGFQFFLEANLGEDIIVSSDYFTDVDYFENGNHLAINAICAKSVDYDGGKPLLIIKTELPLMDHDCQLSALANTEIYLHNERYGIILSNSESISTGETSYKIVQNPVSDRLEVEIYHGVEGENIRFQIVDILGRVVSNNSHTILQSGVSTWGTLLPENLSSSHYYLRVLNTANSITTLPFITIND